MRQLDLFITHEYTPINSQDRVKPFKYDFGTFSKHSKIPSINRWMKHNNEIDIKNKLKELGLYN